MITLNIDCSKIDKKLLKNGKYLDLVLFIKKPSNFGDGRDNQTHMVVQSVSKQEREAGVRGPIVGNAVVKPDSGGPRTVAPPTSQPPADDTDIPF